ncbi:MAG: Hpt domain-containing protein, partial [Kiritimatiellia bacterium]|nr:Hpt domain-containing protein [Kiritimatiellia bacterium]
KKQQKNDAAQLAHTIKGSAANASGNKLHAVALKMETACNAGDWQAAEALIPRLSRQFEMLERAMREYLKKAEGG